MEAKPSKSVQRNPLPMEAKEDNEKHEETFIFMHYEENGKLIAEVHPLYRLLRATGLFSAADLEDFYVESEDSVAVDTDTGTHTITESRYLEFKMAVMNAFIETGKGSIELAHMKQIIQQLVQDHFTKDEISAGSMKLVSEKKIEVEDGRVFLL